MYRHRNNATCECICALIQPRQLPRVPARSHEGRVTLRFDDDHIEGT
jgi:hypothetical protein